MTTPLRVLYIQVMRDIISARMKEISGGSAVVRVAELAAVDDGLSSKSDVSVICMHSYQGGVYSGTSLIRTPLGQKKVSLLVRCPDFRGCNVHKQGVWDSQMCPVYRGVLISGVS